MEELEVLISRKDGALLPEYATRASSGMDLCAYVDEPVTLQPMERTMIPTGIHIGIPVGYEAEIRPRTGIGRTLAGLPVSRRHSPRQAEFSAS